MHPNHKKCAFALGMMVLGFFPSIATAQNAPKNPQKKLKRHVSYLAVIKKGELKQNLPSLAATAGNKQFSRCM
jgi:hypothetical protein